MDTRSGDDRLVLYVDADAERAAQTTDQLTTIDPSLAFITVDRVETALEYHLTEPVDAILTVYQLPDGTAFDLLTQLRDRDHMFPVIIVAADLGETTFSEDVANEFAKYVPLHVDTSAYQSLANRLQNAIDQYATATELEAEKQRYELVTRAASDAFWEWNPSTGDVTHMEGFAESFGYDNSEVEETIEWLTAHIHPKDQTRVIEALEAADTSQGADYEDTYRFRRADGSYAIVLARGFIMDHEDGAQTRMVGALADITSQIEYQARFRDFIEYSPDAIGIIDTDGTVQYISPSIEQVAGLTREDLLDENLLSVVHPDDQPTVGELLRTPVENSGGQTGPLQYRIQTADGGITWVESVARATDADAIVDGYIVNTRNVTEQRERLRTLEQFRQAVEHAGHAIYITDIEGNIEYVNSAFEELTGYSAEEAIGKTQHILASGEHDEAYHRELWETVASGEVSRERIINQQKSGENYTADQTIAPFYDADDELAGVVAIQTDITDRLHREQRLEVLNRLLRHNLRNDLNVIYGHLDNLETNIEEPSLKASVEAIRETVVGLMTETEKGRELEQLLRPDHYGWQPVGVQLEALREWLQQHPPGSTVEVALDVDDSVAVPDVVGRVLRELVENALTHGGDGVEVRVTGRRLNDQRVELRVADTGPGVPSHEQTVIEEGAETPLEHSHGVGLWLSYWLVQSAGGAIRFEDTDEGAPVCVTVPARDTEEMEDTT